jgi:hypothetical protein
MLEPILSLMFLAGVEGEGYAEGKLKIPHHYE